MKNLINLMKKSAALILVVSMASCARTSYVGLSHADTDSVEVFYDINNITNEYEVIGQALGEGHRIEKIQNKLVERAMEEGADAILIYELGRDNYVINQNVVNGTFGNANVADKDQIKATFFKYK